MGIQWSPRMQTVWEIDQEVIAATGKRPIQRYVAERLGVSRQYICYIRHRIDWFERTHRTPDANAHVRLWRMWVAENMRNVLPKLIRAARKQPTRKAPPRVKRQRRFLSPPRYTDRRPTMLTHYNFTQEALREMAKAVHWTDVAYRAGTDYILHIRR